MSVKPAYPLCPICNRSTGGWGYFNRLYKMESKLGKKSVRRFCCKHHQDIYHAIKRKYGEEAMIDPRGNEIAAMRAALKPLSEFIDAEIGFETPLSDYDRHEILALIEVIVTAYHDKLVELAEEQWPQINMPYDPSKHLK